MNGIRRPSRVRMLRIAFLALLGVTLTQAHAMPADDVVCNQCVGPSDLAKRAVTANRIGSRAVRTRHLSRHSVTSAALKPRSVTTSKIREGAVNHSRLAKGVQDTLERLATELDAMKDGDANLVRTVIVSPVGDDAIASGRALLDAVGRTTGLAPTAEFPVLVHVEPGTYEIGDAELSLPRHVSLQGSGELLTTIAGATPGGHRNGVIVANGSNLISDLSLAQRGVFENGIVVDGSKVTIRNLVLRRATSGNTLHRGVRAFDADDLRVENVTALNILIAVETNGGTATIHRLDSVLASTGVLIESGGTVSITDSVLQGMDDPSGSGMNARGVGTRVTVRDSQIANAGLGDDTHAEILNSLLRSIRTHAGNEPATANIAHSQIILPTLIDFDATCVFTYDDVYAPLDSTCQ